MPTFFGSYANQPLQSWFAHYPFTGAYSIGRSKQLLPRTRSWEERKPPRGARHGLLSELMRWIRSIKDPKLLWESRKRRMLLNLSNPRCIRSIINFHLSPREHRTMRTSEYWNTASSQLEEFVHGWGDDGRCHAERWCWLRATYGRMYDIGSNKSCWPFILSLVTRNFIDF